MEEKDKNASQQIDEEEQLESLENDQEQEVDESELDSDNGEVEDGVDDGQQESEAEEPKPSRRENLRIQKLVAKLKEKDRAIEDIKLEGGIDYRKTLDAPDEVYDQLESDRQTFGKTQYENGLKAANSIKFHTRLEIDTPKVMSKYPVFNTESSEFNPSIVNAINEWYLATAGYDAKSDTVKNADVRYSDFVEGIMELADEMAGRKVETTKKNLTKQVASTGLRPDGSSAKRLNLNQAPESMTDEELDAIIGRAIPKKR